MMHEAMFYSVMDEKKVKCSLCPHYCVIGEGKRGICKGRLNKEGILYAENYGRVVTASVDPIEKKPLYHFYPSKYILSISTYGCNFSCDFCQNSELSQNILRSDFIGPEDMVDIAKKKESFGIAYTYSEPMIWYEYILDTSKLAKENNIKNVLVTNGFINQDPLKDMVEYIDAVNLDIKSLSDHFYKKYCRGSLRPVLDTARTFYRNNVHLEITNLIIPGLNDSDEDIENLVTFISEELGREVPVHFSRYFPHYKMDLEPTPVEKLEQAYKTAKKRLDYVYLGNIHTGKGYNNTYCPSCQNLIIDRRYYSANLSNLDRDNRKCSKCGYVINVVI